MTSRGNILEIFSSFQGEGPFAGVRQTFVRLGGCHLRCVYCDTPESWGHAKTCSIEIEPGSEEFSKAPNPVSVETVVETLDRHARTWPPHSISITGGEPLLQTPFLARLLPALRHHGWKTYLDTSGTLSDRLETIVEHLDIIALDWKLPSCPGVTVDLDDVRRCVTIGNRADLFIKIVVREESAPEEVREAARSIGQVSSLIPVILQPASPINEHTRAPSEETITRLLEIAREHLTNVTILPQLHRLSGWK